VVDLARLLFAFRLHVAAGACEPAFHLLCALHAECAGVDHVSQGHAAALRLDDLSDCVERSDERGERFDVFGGHKIDFVDDDDLRAVEMSV